MFIINLIKNILLLIFCKLSGHRPLSEEAQVVMFFAILNISVVLLIWLVVTFVL